MLLPYQKEQYEVCAKSTCSSSLLERVIGLCEVGSMPLLDRRNTVHRATVFDVHYSCYLIIAHMPHPKQMHLPAVGVRCSRSLVGRKLPYV